MPHCSSPRGVKGWRGLGIPATAPYFNGGVLLIHLERWRERNVTQRARRYLESTREPIDFLHQEALNAVLWDDWQPLDSRWNLLASYAGRSYCQPASDAWQSAGIVHFAGRMKPWRVAIGGPFGPPYQEALERLRPLIASEPRTLKERMLGVYDRHIRSSFFPLEQHLWKHRLL